MEEYIVSDDSGEAVLEMPGFDIVAGPEAELDKLMAVNWNMISASHCGGLYTHYVSATRLSANEVRIDTVTAEPIGF